MAQLNIRLDDELREAFDALAEARGQSPSDLARQLIGEAVGRAPDGDSPTVDTSPPALSATQRLVLAAHHDALALLTIEGTGTDGWDLEYHRTLAKIFREGYVAEYHQAYNAIRPELSARSCNLVHDIFQMFTHLEISLERLSRDERASLGESVDYALFFSGFDNNDAFESKLRSYGQFVVEDGRWELMTKYFDREHESGNSHMPMLATYRRMLAAFEPIWTAKTRPGHAGANHYNLTAAELQLILDAWPYPRA